MCSRLPGNCALNNSSQVNDGGRDKTKLQGLLCSTIYSGEKIEAISKLNRRRLVKWIIIWLYNGSVLSLKISCIKAYDDKESCLWYNVKLKENRLWNSWSLMPLLQI